MPHRTVGSVRKQALTVAGGLWRHHLRSRAVIFLERAGEYVDIFPGIDIGPQLVTCFGAVCETLSFSTMDIRKTRASRMGDLIGRGEYESKSVIRAEAG